VPARLIRRVSTFEQATAPLNQITKSAKTFYETTRSPDQRQLELGVRAPESERAPA
jgi:hypothetical protein